MEKLIGKIIIVYGLFTLGMSFSDVFNCRNRECFRKIETAKRKVLDVNWKSISMFPEEARKFR